MLSPIEQTFVEAYALNGQNGTEAYLEANPEVSRGSAATLANRLLRKVEIINAIQKLREPRRKAVILTLERKRELLSDFAEDGEIEPNDRIKAILADAKLAGELSQDKAADKQAEATNALAMALARIQAVTHG